MTCFNMVSKKQDNKIINKTFILAKYIFNITDKKRQ